MKVNEASRDRAAGKTSSARARDRDGASASVGKRKVPEVNPFQHRDNSAARGRCHSGNQRSAAGARPSGVRVLDLGISFKLAMIFHPGVLASQRPITLGYPAPAFGERRYKRSFGLFVCTNRTCGVVRVIDHGLPLWQLLRAGSYDASLLCAAFRRAAMVSHSAARSNKTRLPVSSESARASHRQRAAWCNRSAWFNVVHPQLLQEPLKRRNDLIQYKIRGTRDSCSLYLPVLPQI